MEGRGKATRPLAFAREVSVIVLGVLIALGAQAWYEARADAQRLSDYLSSLESDLQRDSAFFTRLHEALGDQVAAADRLLLGVANPVFTVGQDSLAGLINGEAGTCGIVWP